MGSFRTYVRNVALLLFLTATLGCRSVWAADPQVAVFVSFSMPDMSLRQWIREAGKIDAPVVTRGLVHDSLKETVARFSRLVASEGTNRGGIQVNPVLFRKYGIRKVPAVVVTDRDDSSRWDVVYGNVSLEYALTKIAERGGTASAAREALERLRKSRRHA